MACCKSLACSITTIVIGLLLVIGASIFLGIKVAETLINSQVNEKMVLSLDSFIFPEWADPPPPIYMQYWLFNVTNSANASKGGKPTVEQVGPITYRLYQPKTDIAFYTNNTVSYKFNHTLVFLPEKSDLLPNATITQVNVPLLTVQSLASKIDSRVLHWLVKLIVDALSDGDIFVEHTVEEWLFGYPDPVFKKVHDIIDRFPFIHLDFPAEFGLFYQYNNSNDGVYLVNAGRTDIREANQICLWNGNSSLSWWSSPEANMVNGTDGSFMSPKIDSSEKLYIFVTDICRSLYFKFEQHSSVQNIDTWRFTMPAEVFANATENPDNAGFCVPAGNCLDSGVLDISTCKQGAPIVVSSPHFYLAKEKYINGVNGMHPNKDDHQTVADIEPLSGSVFAVAKRLQINAHLQNLGLLSSLQGVEDVILPILWLNESATLDTATADKFKTQVEILIKLVHILPYVLLGLGLLLSLIGCVLLFCYFRKRKVSHASVPLFEDDDSSSE